MIYLLALLIGVVAGLRALTALAAVSIAAYLGWIGLDGSFLSFLASPWAAGILTLLALGELVNDQLPKTPSRKEAAPFGARLVSGAASGAALGVTAGMLTGGLVVGLVGAVLGTYGGYAARAWLAKGFGRDLPAALIEDVVAIGGAFLIVCAAAA